MATMRNFWNDQTFLKTKLDTHRSKTGKIEWIIYFAWYFKASQHYQESTFATLHNKILRLTEANTQLKDKIAFSALGSLPLFLCLRLCLQGHLCPPLKFSLLPPLLTWSVPVLFTMKFSGVQRAKSVISYILWIKANVPDIVKDFPE